MSKENRTYVDNFLDVWSIKTLTLPEKAVLSNLARRAANDGTGAFPSEFRIAIETSQSTKTVERVLVSLMGKGYISRKRHVSGKSSSLFGNWEYEINVMRIADEAEDGEEASFELMEVEREKVRLRVETFREKQRQKAAPVTDTPTLRNRQGVVTVTDSQSLCNGQSVCLTPPLTAPFDLPSRLQRNEPLAASRETRSTAANQARAPARTSFLSGQRSTFV
jgi:hypothetical protein